MPRYQPALVGTPVMALAFLMGCGGQDLPGADGPQSPSESIDQRSYRLGSIGAFAEMVDAGVKTLALSAAVDPSEMDAMVEEATRIAAEHDVEVFRETDFLVTDLFPTEITEGKHVLLIFRGDTRQRYMDLKEEKLRLQGIGEYQGEARREIGRSFGALLSYSGEKIEALLQAGQSGL